MSISTNNNPLTLRTRFDAPLLVSHAPTIRKFFECRFDNAQSPTFDVADNWPTTEPVAYICDKTNSVWNWISNYRDGAAFAHSGVITIENDPYVSGKTCVKLNRNAGGPFESVDQHCKLYELQGRSTGGVNNIANYQNTDWSINKRGWWNWDIYIPTGFNWSSWILIWQSYGSEPVGDLGGPQFQIVYSSGYLYFKIQPWASSTGASIWYMLCAVSSLPTNQWVHMSLFLNQGTGWQHADGVGEFWVNGVRVWQSTAVESTLMAQAYGDTTYIDSNVNVAGTSAYRIYRDTTSDYYGVLPSVAKASMLTSCNNREFSYHAWGIANYAGYDAYDGYLMFRDVNVASKRISSTKPTR